MKPKALDKHSLMVLRAFAARREWLTNQQVEDRLKVDEIWCTTEMLAEAGLLESGRRASTGDLVYQISSEGSDYVARLGPPGQVSERSVWARLLGLMGRRQAPNQAPVPGSTPLPTGADERKSR